MVAEEQRIVDLGAEIVWVLEQSPAGAPGTAELCEDFLAAEVHPNVARLDGWSKDNSF